jgi:hypothetical protein
VGRRQANGSLLTLTHPPCSPSQLSWEGGKKTVTLSEVVRVSVGLETKGLQKLYASGAMDIPTYNW